MKMKNILVVAVLILSLVSLRLVHAENPPEETEGSIGIADKEQAKRLTESDRKAALEKGKQSKETGRQAESEKQEQKKVAHTGNADNLSSKPTLEKTRLTMDKWIEAQQIISRERKDWQQGKEIVLGRLELVKKEVATLEEKTKQAESSVAEANKKRSELLAENDQLKAAGEQLTVDVISMEGKIRRLFKLLPEPTRTKLQPLYQRIPEDTAKTNVSVAERFQNVLGILNELNKANNEITVSYEVHNLADGKPSEVKTMYVGLAQAYYVSAGGEAGIGRPTANGWKWEPSKDVGSSVVMALEILDGKQSPAFVGVPVKLQ